MSLAVPARLGVLLALLASLLVAAPTTASLAADGAGVFINEFHYDNEGTDTGEFVEVAGPAGTDLTGWEVVLYNGADGSAYTSTALTGLLSGSSGSGVGFAVVEYPSNGIQNGSPDGLALVDPSGTVVEFFSYEGAFTAVGGPADGLESTDVDVEEGGSTPIGFSLQRDADCAWTGPSAETKGGANPSQAPACDPLVVDDPVDPDDAPAATDVFLNEFHYDNVSTDVGEFVEVAGPAGTDLTGWQVVLYNGNGGAPYDTRTLTGRLSGTLGSGVGFAIVEYPTNGIQNGSPDGIALVDPSGAVVEFLSYEGTFTAVGGPADGVASIDVGVVESNATTLAGESLQRTSDCTWVGPLTETRNTRNADQADRCDAPDPEPEPADVFIHEVQGSGDVSPLVGQEVTVEAVVVGDFQAAGLGSEGDLGGFYIQEEDSQVDVGEGSELTSEGLFVFNGFRPTVDVEVGDRVRVTGTVSEFANRDVRRTQTQVTAFDDAVEVIEEDVTLPTPAELSLPLDGVGFPERFEGMRVSIAQDLYVAEYFNLDRFGEMVLTQQASGLVTPTQVTEPGSDAYEDLLSFNQRSQITLDDGRSIQNPDPVPFVDPNLAEGTYDDNRRRGDRLGGIAGVLGDTFDRYRIQVDTDVVTTDSFTTTIPRPTEAPEVGGDVQVASFNVLNYFTTIDEDGNTCGPNAAGCRGADNAEELERQTAKTVTALAALDADVVGLIEIENDGDDSSVATLVDGLNALLGDGTYDYVRTGFVGGDAIKQAFIYKPAVVTPDGEPAVLDTDDFINGLQSTPKNRAALAQTFVGDEGGAVTVVVNHLKSKGSWCGPGDDADDGSGNCDGTRTRAAELLLDWIEDPATGFAEDVLVIGDLNAYAQEAPIRVFEDAGYVNTVLDEDPDAYGYVFDAQQGTLDYALASPSLAGQVTGSAEYGINADEADLIDYNTDFGRGTGYFNPNIPYRASDHDPVITGLELDSVNGPTTADAGGPYEVTVDGSVQLDATGSSDGPGLGLTYAWDLDEDGVFDDAVGATPTWDRPGGPPGPKVISVEVTDVLGGTSVADAEAVVLANGRGNDGRPRGRFMRGSVR